MTDRQKSEKGPRYYTKPPSDLKKKIAEAQKRSLNPKRPKPPPEGPPKL